MLEAVIAIQCKRARYQLQESWHYKMQNVMFAADSVWRAEAAASCVEYKIQIDESGLSILALFNTIIDKAISMSQSDL